MRLNESGSQAGHSKHAARSARSQVERQDGMGRGGGRKAIMLSPDTVTQNRDRWIAIKKALFH
jgi:hypothetical protein